MAAVLDIFYSGVLVAFVLVWFSFTKLSRAGRFVRVLRRNRFALTLLVWAVFLGFLSLLLTNFSYFNRIHDVPEAVGAAVTGLLGGINPYASNVVPRFSVHYSGYPSWSMGPYNYMPLDLLVYAGFEQVFRPLGEPGWFVLANLLFSGVAMFLLNRLICVRLISFLPIAGLVSLFYSFDNGSLTFLLMVSSVCALKKSRTHPEALAIVLMGLAVLTKIYAAVPFVVLLAYELQERLMSKDWRKLVHVAVATCSSAVAAVAVMLPFGISHVLDAAVFFHANGASRVGTSAGGTVLAEIALSSPYFEAIGILLVVSALLISLRFTSLNDRMVLIVLVFLLVAVKSSQSPLMMLGLFLVLKMRETVHPAPVTVDDPADRPLDSGVRQASPYSNSRAWSYWWQLRTFL